MGAHARTGNNVQTCHTLLIRTASLWPINNLSLCQETKFPLNFYLWTRQVSALSSFLASLMQQHIHVVHAFWMLVLGPLPCTINSSLSPSPPGQVEGGTAAVPGDWSIFSFLSFFCCCFFSCTAHPCNATQGCKYLNEVAVESSSLPAFFFLFFLSLPGTPNRQPQENIYILVNMHDWAE